LLSRDGKNLIRRDRHRVGDDHLLAQPDDEPPHPFGKIGGRNDAGHDLARDVVVANDRPGDELWEEEDVKRKVYRASAGADNASIDVHLIRDLMEGKEGDAERERNFGEVKMRRENGL
jgi:hypothetical protein